MDDILLAGSHTRVLPYEDYLNQFFVTKDMGMLRYLIGIKVAYQKNELLIYLRKYVLSLLQDTSLLVW